MKTESFTSTRQWFSRLMTVENPSGFWKWLSGVLYILSIFYGWMISARLKLYQTGLFRVRHLPKKVISVGNLTVGGTGKTPTVLFLAKYFRDKGQKVAVLSRGYGRTHPGRDLLVSDGIRVQVTPEESGEEAFFLASELKGAIVAVGKNRYRLAKFLLNRFKIDLFILDDGFQHLQLYRDVNILLFDHDNPVGNGFLIPRGILREPVQNARRATLILETRKGLVQKDELHYSNRLKFDMIPKRSVIFAPECFIHLQNGERFSIESLTGKNALAVSALGNPGSFRNLIEACRIEIVRELIFPDHHFYGRDDIVAILDIARSRKVDMIVTTEKDGVKLKPMIKTDLPVFALRLRTILQNDLPWDDLLVSAPGVRK